MTLLALEVFGIAGEVAREIDVFNGIAKALFLEKSQGLLIVRFGIDQDHSSTLLDEEIGQLFQ